jgi:hypothetical protein
MFQSKVRNAQIVFEKGKIKAKLEMIDGTTEDYMYSVDMIGMIEDMASLTQ